MWNLEAITLLAVVSSAREGDLPPPSYIELRSLPSTDSAERSGSPSAWIRERLERADETTSGDHSPTDLWSSAARFYQARAFVPAWRGSGLRAGLVEALQSARLEGLDPERYRARRLGRELDRGWPDDPAGAAALDIAFTLAFLRAASHYAGGLVDPAAADIDWQIPRPPVDAVPTLEEAMAAGDIAAGLRSLLPRHPVYRRLRDALARYRALAAAGGWAPLPAGPPLRSGDSGERVAVLRHRLSVTGDLARAAGEALPGAVFDENVEYAVRSFQQRHGLAVDGVVGPTTQRALDVPVEHRIEKILLNLERWRWMPASLGQRHLLVDVAGYRVRAYRDGHPALSMRAVIGRRYRQTPIISGEMTSLVFGPSWNVPRRIAIEDILPLARLDPERLERQGFQVLQGWGEHARPLDLEEIPWHRLGRRYFPYRLHQGPGAANPMGQVKFVFPNEHDVYLHDTPSRELFDARAPTFSSGCIRVSEPRALARFLLDDPVVWNDESVTRAMMQGRDRRVSLTRPVPVYLGYWTAWAEVDGMVHFRDDIYGRDFVIAERLKTLEPGPALVSQGTMFAPAARVQGLAPGPSGSRAPTAPGSGCGEGVPRHRGIDAHACPG